MSRTSLEGDSPAQSSPRKPAAGRFWALPKTALGWWAFALTVAFFPLFLTVTRATGWFLVHAPFFADTPFFPALFVVFIDASAVLNVVSVVRNRERSALVILALIVSVAVGLFATVFLVGEAFTPAG